MLLVLALACRAPTEPSSSDQLAEDRLHTPTLELHVSDFVTGQPLVATVHGADDGDTVDLWSGTLAAPQCWPAWGTACGMLVNATRVGSGVSSGGVAVINAAYPAGFGNGDWLAFQAVVSAGVDTRASRAWVARSHVAGSTFHKYTDLFFPSPQSDPTRIYPFTARDLTLYDPAADEYTGTSDWFTFDLDAGLTARVTVTDGAGQGDPQVDLIDPAGEYAEPKYGKVNGASSVSWAATSTSSGTWTLLVDDDYPTRYDLDFQVVAPTEDSWWYPDVDGDGFGDAAAGVFQLLPPEGWLVDGGDCDDAAADVHPGAWDACDDGVDTDCDGQDRACHAAIGAAEDVADAASTWWQGQSASGQLGIRLANGGDLDGDGDDELLATEPVTAGVGGGRLWVLPGGPTGINLVDTALGAWQAYNADVAIVGLAPLPDVDGDGVRDLAFTAPGHDANDGLGAVGTAFVAHGPVSGIQYVSAADASFRPPVGQQIVEGIAGADDATGDGAADLVVLDGAAAEITPADVIGDVDLSLSSTRLTHALALGSALCPDLDGDGVDEVVIGRSAEDGFNGRAWVVTGPVPAGTVDLDAAAGARLVTTNHQRIGGSFAAADLDGDGLPELAVTPERDSVADAWLFSGPLAGDVDVSSAWVTLVGAAGDANFQLALPGDVDGDGAADVVVGSGNTGGGDGAVYLVFGPLVGGVVDASASGASLGQSSYGRLGDAVAGGDFDGDGLGDLAAGEAYDDPPGGPGGAGAVWIVFGSP